MSEQTELASRWLRSALRVTNASRKIVSSGPGSPDEIITTNRLILVLAGKLDYKIEDRTIRLGTGSQFLVPAWVRRVWTVPRGGPSEIIWCEFDDGGIESPWKNCSRRKLSAAEFRKEKTSYLEMVRLFSNSKTDNYWDLLQLEAQLKLTIVRFLEKAEVPSTELLQSNNPNLFHPKVKSLLQWLAAHFHEPSVLEEMFRLSEMTPNYFRKLFMSAMKCSPHQYIERLRMRHARYLLRETELPIKQIAGECGYQDALYFSRVYRRFRGCSPAGERTRR